MQNATFQYKLMNHFFACKRFCDFSPCSWKHEPLGSFSFVIKRHCQFKISTSCQRKMGKCSPRSYQEGLIRTLTEGRVIRAVDWRLTGELRVKLTHVFSWLLRRWKRRQTQVRRCGNISKMCRLTTRGYETREDPGSVTETYSVSGCN